MGVPLLDRRRKKGSIVAKTFRAAAVKQCGDTHESSGTRWSRPDDVFACPDIVYRRRRQRRHRLREPSPRGHPRTACPDAAPSFIIMVWPWLGTRRVRHPGKQWHTSIRRTAVRYAAAEHPAHFRGCEQVLDWLKVCRENALRCEARYAAGTATITNYHGAAPAAELHSSAAE